MSKGARHFIAMAIVCDHQGRTFNLAANVTLSVNRLECVPRWAYWPLHCVITRLADMDSNIEVQWGRSAISVTLNAWVRENADLVVPRAPEPRPLSYVRVVVFCCGRTVGYADRRDDKGSTQKRGSN